MGRWYSQEKSETYAQRNTNSVEPQPSYKERVSSKISERAKIKRLEKEPIVRKAHIESQQKAIELKRKEIAIAREQRQVRAEQIRQSAPVRGAQQVRYGAQRFRQYQFQQSRARDLRRHYAPAPLGVAPGSLQRDYGYGSVGSVQPSYRPSTSVGAGPSKLPIHSMGSIRSGGASYFAPSIDVGGKIPRGIIKSYWSKKVKALAKSNVKKYGPEEGIDRTYQMAAELGWKMQ